MSWLVHWCLERFSLRADADSAVTDGSAEVEGATEPSSAANCRSSTISEAPPAAINTSSKLNKAVHATFPDRGLIAAIKAHLNEDHNCVPQGSQSPAPAGYHYTVDFSALPDPETLPNNTLDLFPKPQLAWPWAQPDARSAESSPELPVRPVQTASATSAGGDAGAISPQCEQRLRASITKGLLEELRAEYEYKQMETEADCVARIVAVEMSCTNKIAMLAQQHHVGLERIKQMVKSKAARFQKALKLETATAYRAGYKAGLRKAGTATATPTGAQRSPSAAHAPASPQHSGHTMVACDQTNPAGQHKMVAFLQPVQPVQPAQQDSPARSQHSPAKVTASGLKVVKVGCKAPVSFRQHSQQAVPAPAQPSAQLLSVAAMRISKDDSRAPGHTGSNDQQDPSLIPLPVSLLSKLTGTAAAAATAAADATAMPDATAAAAVAGFSQAGPQLSAGFGARVLGFSEYGYGDMRRGMSSISLGDCLFAEPSYNAFSPGILMGPWPYRLGAAQAVGAERAASAEDAVLAAAAAAAGAAAGGAGMGWERQPLVNIGNVLGGGGEVWEGSDWKIGVSPIGLRRQVSRAASRVAMDGDEVKSSVMQLFEMQSLAML